MLTPYSGANTFRQQVRQGWGVQGGNAGRTYRDTLAVRDFRLLWLAEVLSTGGDQLTRIALMVLVYGQTGSAVASGLVYGLTFFPTLLGSVLLAGYADHYPRHLVMTVCNGARAVLTALVAIPGIPLWLLAVLVAASTTFLGPFRAAEQALLPDMLAGRLYILGMSLRTASQQVAQLVGFALGATIIYLLTPTGGLLFDAATFAIAAFLTSMISTRHSTAGTGERALSTTGLRRGFQAFVADRRLLALAAVLVLNLFHIVPEGLAAPLAAQFHQGTWAVALIQASAPIGAIIGVFVLGRLIPDDKQAAMVGPAAIGAGLVLIPMFLPVGLPMSVVLFALAGGLSAVYTLYAQSLIAQLAPEHNRGRVVGVTSALLQTANGVGPLLGGLVAAAFLATGAVAIAGVASAVCALLIMLWWLSTTRTNPVTTGAGATG